MYALGYTKIPNVLFKPHHGLNLNQGCNKYKNISAITMLKVTVTMVWYNITVTLIVVASVV
jgi:hypothetical protein